MDRLLAGVIAVALVASACSSDPTESAEYREMLADRDAALTRVVELERDLGALEVDLGTATSLSVTLESDLADSESRLGALESENRELLNRFHQLLLEHVSDFGYYIEPGVPVDESLISDSVNRASAGGSRFYLVLLEDDLPSLAVDLADALLDGLISGTVLVLSESQEGMASTELDQERLESALDAGFVAEGGDEGYVSAVVDILILTTSTCPAFHGVACDGWVTDAAGVITDDGRLEAATSQLVATYGHEIAVVIIPSSGSLTPQAFAEGLGNMWGVGDSQRNDGIVVLVALEERRTEIVTGSGLTIDDLDTVASAGDAALAAGGFDVAVIALLGALDLALGSQA